MVKYKQNQVQAIQFINIYSLKSTQYIIIFSYGNIFCSVKLKLMVLEIIENVELVFLNSLLKWYDFLMPGYWTQICYKAIEKSKL